MVDARWMWLVLVVCLPAGAWVGWLTFAVMANRLYEDARRDGWKARVKWEREHEDEMLEEFRHREFVTRMGVEDAG